MSDAGSSNKPQPGRVGSFIQTYHSFLSSFVIGAAGLVATSIWQYRQSEMAAKQADSQQQIAKAQADNNWRIERAEILSKNLDVLSASGPDTVERRYGVLLSLTRGNILDPELAVSYALELGKDSPSYMKSVLLSTTDKSYARLASSYEVSCQQRFGVVRDVAICPKENHVERSLELTDLFAEELDAARKKNQDGPLGLLTDERSVQNMPLKLTALFSSYLVELFERRQKGEVAHFEGTSTGAHLISALVLSPTQPNAFVSASDVAAVNAFHKERADWLKGYLYGESCNGECRGKLVDIMLTWFAEAEGRYDAAFKELFTRERSEVAVGISHLHHRLLQCQVDGADAEALRDRVLVPSLVAAVKRKPFEQTLFEDLLGLIALTPDPGFAPDPASVKLRTDWEAAMTIAREAYPEVYNTGFTMRRVSAQNTRKNPPAKMQKTMFCTADEVSLADSALDDE
ncbi:MAG: hypothetical protein QM778_20955 [Myxococcales bacterium]